MDLRQRSLPAAPGAGGLPHGPAWPGAAAPVFDVCHGGVVLRALLCVHAVAALALAWQAGHWRAWTEQLSLLALVLLPATLAWLLLACAAQRALARWPRPGYWAAALLGGAGCAVLAGLAWRSLAGVLDPASPRPATPWLALCSAATGAAFAGAMLHWLEQRARLRGPVDARARLAELQARIRPHFLFNALNSAIALVQVDPARAEDVLEDLADLFRAALAEPAGIVTLDDELTLARRYLSIEQVRFGARLALHWQVDAAAGAAQLPPLVLQPLVENAVRHGVERCSAGSEVVVRTRAERGAAVIEITNTLPGADPAPPAAAPGHGIGLRNVRERLYLMHDVHLQFHAGPDGAGRWVVRIVVPLARGGER